MDWVGIDKTFANIPLSLYLVELIFSLNLVENGPYQEKAKAVYQELRSNLIRYCLILFGTFEIPLKVIGGLFE